MEQAFALNLLQKLLFFDLGAGRGTGCFLEKGFLNPESMTVLSFPHATSLFIDLNAVPEFGCLQEKE